LALVHSTILLNEIIESEDFQEQHQQILNNLKKKNSAAAESPAPPRQNLSAEDSAG